jgi:phospholipid/cholesterol/gamma-HCH transport system substrate-binding protein
MIALLALLVGLALAFYTSAFRPVVAVTVETGRKGLLLTPKSDVRMLGIPVGKVTEVELAQTGQAVIEVELYKDQAERIPANTGARIVASTAFGPKYVELVTPSGPFIGQIHDGVRIQSEHVSVEVNTVFENLLGVLEAVEPAKLNSTLKAVSTALEGNGEKLGTTLVQTDEYLRRFNSNVPQLQRDLSKIADVTNLYADVTPDLVRLLENGTFTGRTVSEERQALDAVLADLLALGENTRTFLEANERGLVTLLDVLRPTTALLSEYSPMLTCTINGIEVNRHMLENVVGGNGTGLALNAGLMPGDDPYTYPESLAVVEASSGPSCYGLPLLEGNEYPHQYVPYSTGANAAPGGDDNSLQPGDPPLVVQLFGPAATPPPPGTQPPLPLPSRSGGS